LADYDASEADVHGPSGVFTDLNEDGYPDLYLVTSARRPNQLFVNVPGPFGGRTFELMDDSGSGDLGDAVGAVASDYDNDGDVDLYVLNVNQPNLLLQSQWAQSSRLTFIDVTAATDPTPSVDDDQFGVATTRYEGSFLNKSLTAAWADVDRDGHLDLYVGNHNGAIASPTEGPVPGQRDILYHNDGDGTFTDITMLAGVPGYVSANGAFSTENQHFSSSNAVIFVDLNNDSWPDLFVTNKAGGPDDRDMLYMNLGAGEDESWLGFKGVTYELPIPFGHVTDGAMGVDVADFDNDGDLDIYVTDVGPLFVSGGENDLWINQLSETGEMAFQHSDMMPGSYSWGAQWQDFNNDGWIDLHVATHVLKRDFLYFNDEGEFEELGAAVGIGQIRNTRGDLTADYDRDGLVDMFEINLNNERSKLYHNNLAAGAGARFLSIQLVGDPSTPAPYRSTRDAVGARVEIVADLNGDGIIGPRERQLREVVAGNGNAAGTSSMRLEVGMGFARSAEIEILWPSGRRSTERLESNQFVTIVENADDE
jgi:hypothetical protein